ncbi:hypothetical protein PN584_17130, partial [Parabacteroides merdae]|uniref:hypothetical protein n=1 Tax=Parabacteroides merdae TaxID=46503 RepID=UPI00232DF2B7
MYKVEITNNNKYELELDRANVVVGSGGTVVPVWGTIIGDITQQKDLQEELTGIKESIPDLTQVNEDIANLESVKANKSEIPDVTGLATKEDLKSRVTMSPVQDRISFILFIRPFELLRAGDSYG